MVLRRGGQGRNKPSSSSSSSWLIASGLVSLIGVFLCLQLFVVFPHQLTVLSSSSSSSLQSENGGFPITPIHWNLHHHHNQHRKAESLQGQKQQRVGAGHVPHHHHHHHHDESTTITTPHNNNNNNNNSAQHDHDHHHHNSYNHNSHHEFDIVTLVHHDDLSVFVDYGLASWNQYFCQPNTRIFVVCTPEAQQKMEQLRAYSANNQKDDHWKNVILVSQVVYPFNLELVGVHNWGNKFTWIYQQLLKVYAYEVLSTRGSKELALKQRFLVLDSDTVAIRPYTFISHDDGKPLYNIASLSSGAFQNDSILQPRLLREVFPDNSVPAAFPDHNGEKFTTITHHMMMDGKILAEMLSTISKLHNKPAWQVLSSLKDSVLSEWEIYMAWIMKYHRDSFYLIQTPYINSGRVDGKYLKWLKQTRDVYYLSKHDDYSATSMCCVNSKWPTIVEPNAPNCGCCTQQKCQPPKITCDMLGVPGCRQDSHGLMYFFESSSSSSSSSHPQTTILLPKQ